MAFIDLHRHFTWFFLIFAFMDFDILTPSSGLFSFCLGMGWLFRKVYCDWLQQQAFPSSVQETGHHLLQPFSDFQWFPVKIMSRNKCKKKLSWCWTVAQASLNTFMLTFKVWRPKDWPHTLAIFPYAKKLKPSLVLKHYLFAGCVQT